MLIIVRHLLLLLITISAELDAASPNFARYGRRNHTGLVSGQILMFLGGVAECWGGLEFSGWQIIVDTVIADLIWM